MDRFVRERPRLDLQQVRVEVIRGIQKPSAKGICRKPMKLCPMPKKLMGGKGKKGTPNIEVVLTRVKQWWVLFIFVKLPTLVT